MANIIIRNIGPIKEAKFDLNKVNVFIGPQSSGKSTIAKIISYCTWIEKDVATSQSLEEYNTNGNFKKKLEDFHKLSGYFKDTSEIYYKSNIIDLEFKSNRCLIQWIDKHAYQRSKIVYLPSERNLIVLPFIQKVDMLNNNNRSFLFDWLTSKSQFNKDNKMKILNLPVEYYYDENTGENHISSTNTNDDYDILLENASSGLQSLTPLIASIKYLTEWIYENEEEISFEKQQKLAIGISILVDDLVLSKFYQQGYTGEERKSKIEDFNKKLAEKDEVALQLFSRWEKVKDSLQKTHNSQFVIEEPEQNLFPSTQKELIYHLLGSFNFERGDRATITTHSPYILYALNNCMLGHLVKEKMLQDDDYKTLKSLQSSIDPQKVSVWQITDEGTINNIQGEDNLIEGNYFDACMKDVMDDFYKMINYYGDEDED